MEELSDTSDSEQMLEPDSGEPEIQLSKTCTKVCCIESRIFQPSATNNSLLKKTEKVFGSGKNARQSSLV